MPRMLDLFAGRLGWTKAFLALGWECVAVDMVEPPDLLFLPRTVEFYQANVLGISHQWIKQRLFDFICVSSPCEEFAVFGMRHFHPNPPQPILGLKLFHHARTICELSGVPFLMENVRAAQGFVGKAKGNAGSFFLWGNAVPENLPKCKKGATQMRRDGRYKRAGGVDELMYSNKTRATRLLEQRQTA